MSDKVNVTVKLEKKVYRALEWYLPYTSYWVTNAREVSKDQAISEWIAKVILENLEAEASKGAPSASDFIANELKSMLNVEK
jgi:hypothetical protein